MTRKLSKKKISHSPRYTKNKTTQRKKNLNNKKKSKFSKKYRQKGGNTDNLNSAIQSMLAKNSNLTSGKPSQKKGLIKNIISFFPFGNSLVGASEEKEARKLQQDQDREQEQKLEKELDASKSPSNKRKEEIAEEIKTTIEESTNFARTKPFSSLVKEGRNNSIREALNKTVNSLVGVNKEVADTAQEVKKQVPGKVCNAQFIANLDNNLLEDCGEEELINVYNIIARIILSKKQFYTPQLEEKISKLPILDFHESKHKEPELNIKNLDITQRNKDTIHKLQEEIEKKLQVSKKLGKSKKKKKKNKKKKATSSNNENPSESSV